MRKLTDLTKNIHCIVFYYKKQRGKDPLIAQLEKHLALARINVVSKIWEKDKSIPYLHSNTKNHQVDFVIYSMSSEFVAQLQITNHDLNIEAYKVKTLLTENPTPIVFLLLDKQAIANTNNIKDNQFNFVYLDFTKHENYYILVFELLKKFLPNHNVDKYIAEFNKQYATLIGTAAEDKLSKENTLETASKTTKPINCENTNHPKIRALLYRITFVFAIICLGFFIFNPNNTIKFFTTALPKFTKAKKQTAIFNLPPRYSNFTGRKDILTKNQTVTFNLPPRNNKFTGRQDVLSQIDKLLYNQKFGVITQAITGLGGVGKTQLAIEFAYRAIASKQYSVILWIPAETTNTIQNAYKEIAEQLQVNIQGLELNNIQTLVHKQLALLCSQTKILFILDNAPNYDEVNDYLAKIYKGLSPITTPQILITSRAQHWPEPPLIADVFTQDEALTFVQKYLPNEKIEKINKLTTTLHFFPLAINQAAAYINSHTNIDDYLQLYATKQKDYLDKFSGDKNIYSESLWATWNIALNKLSSTAKELLSISAYLNPDNIPLDFFDHLDLETRVNSIEELRKHSFIILTNNNTAFRVHRLLQEVIRNTNVYTINNKWLMQAIALVKKKFDFNYLQSENWATWSKYLTNARIVANHALKTKGYLLKEGITLYSKTAMFSTHILLNSDNDNIISWLRLLEAVKKYYPKNTRLLLLANIDINLSTVYRLSGNSKKAIIYATKAIAIYQQKYHKITTDSTKLLNILRLIPLNGSVSLSNAIKYDQGYALTQLGNVYFYSLVNHNNDAILNYNKALTCFQQINDISPDIIKYNKIDTLYNISMSEIHSGNLKSA